MKAKKEKSSPSQSAARPIIVDVDEKIKSQLIASALKKAAGSKRNSDFLLEAARAAKASIKLPPKKRRASSSSSKSSATELKRGKKMTIVVEESSSNSEEEVSILYRSKRCSIGWQIVSKQILLSGRMPIMIWLEICPPSFVIRVAKVTYSHKPYSVLA